MVSLKSHICADLPIEWQNKISSVLINKCIVLYTTENCKHTKDTQIFTNSNQQRNIDINFSSPSNIPSLSFYGTRYTFYKDLFGFCLKKFKKNLKG